MNLSEHQRSKDSCFIHLYVTKKKKISLIKLNMFMKYNIPLLPLEVFIDTLLLRTD